MKKLYQINKVLVIINIILGFTIYFGLLFLIPLGITQLIMSLIIAYNKKDLSNDISILFSVYIVITSIILLCILCNYLGYIHFDDSIFYLGMGTSILMAFLHLYITYLIQKT